MALPTEEEFVAAFRVVLALQLVDCERATRLMGVVVAESQGGQPIADAGVAEGARVAEQTFLGAILTGQAEGIRECARHATNIARAYLTLDQPADAELFLCLAKRLDAKVEERLRQAEQSIDQVRAHAIRERLERRVLDLTLAAVGAPRAAAKGAPS